MDLGDCLVFLPGRPFVWLFPNIESRRSLASGTLSQNGATRLFGFVRVDTALRAVADKRSWTTRAFLSHAESLQTGITDESRSVGVDGLYNAVVNARDWRVHGGFAIIEPDAKSSRETAAEKTARNYGNSLRGCDDQLSWRVAFNNQHAGLGQEQTVRFAVRVCFDVQRSICVTSRQRVQRLNRFKNHKKSGKSKIIGVDLRSGCSSRLSSDFRQNISAACDRKAQMDILVRRCWYRSGCAASY